MFDLFCLWFGAVLRIFHNRQNLLLENLALRQQLVVLKRRHRKPKLGAGRIPGTAVLAVVARRAISAQPPLPTNLIIFGLTGQPGWKKAMVPPFCEQTIADGELTFPRSHKNRLYRLAKLKICLRSSRSARRSRYTWQSIRSKEQEVRCAF